MIDVLMRVNPECRKFYPLAYGQAKGAYELGVTLALNGRKDKTREYLENAVQIFSSLEFKREAADAREALRKLTEE